MQHFLAAPNRSNWISGSTISLVLTHVYHVIMLGNFKLMIMIRKIGTRFFNANLLNFYIGLLLSNV